MELFGLLLVAAGILKTSSTEVTDRKFFTDIPSDGYFQRHCLEDCPSHFYSKIDQSITTPDNKQVQNREYQHVVSIGWTNEEKIQYRCGGTLLSSRFILTAAHCAEDNDGIPPDTVSFGNGNTASGVKDAQQIPIRQFRKHPQYRFSRKYFDIAIIELEHEVYFTDSVCPACLWLEKDFPMEPMSAIKLGFGDFFERSSPKFEKVTLSFINKTECEERMPLSERSLPNGLLDDQFCAGSDNEDTCEGDSGTPLFVERQDLDGTIIPLVVGIVSFGTLCTDGSTGVYTRVASYKEWIEKEIQSNLSYSACSRNAQSHTKHQTYGNTAANQQLPYHRVEIISNHTDLYAYHCGATMVDYKFAVTSALCAAKIHAPPMYIFVESTKEIIPIDKVYVHPQYSQNKPENDIALLRLTKYLKGEMPLVPACLYRTGETQVLLDKIYYTVRSNQFGNRTRTHTIRMQIKQDNQCNSLINHLNHTMHCGRHQVPLIPSICKVDYGGAISRNVSSPCLYGVVSSLSLGCNSDLFGTKISPYVDWIDHIILNNYSNDLNVSP